MSKIYGQSGLTNSVDPDQTYSVDPDQTTHEVSLKEQSGQGLHCLPFCLHLLDTSLYLYVTTTLFKFLDDYCNFLGVIIFWNYKLF